MKSAVVFFLLATSAVYPQGRKYNLPAPNPAGQVSNPAKVIPQPPGKTLTVPDGFSAAEYASGFQKPRMLLQLPGGKVLVTESVAKGGVYEASGGKDRKAVISGLDRPFDLLFHDGYLYVTEAEAVKRFKFNPSTLEAGEGEKIVDLAGYGKGHWTRSLAIDPRAKKLYVAVGSGSNVDLGDPPNRNAVNVYNLDGSDPEIFATGLRNPVAIRFHPQSGRLWTTVQERDGLGDELAPDFFTEVKRGGFYGWPYAYAGPNEDPRHKGVNLEAVRKTLEPDVLLGAHVSAMAFTFYTGRQFPARYRNGAFIALRGSSGRTKRVGYSVVFQPFKGGKPAGALENFLTGFMLGEDSKEVWGRPVGVTQLADGSLLLSEDGNNKIWRISYGK